MFLGEPSSSYYGEKTDETVAVVPNSKTGVRGVVGLLYFQAPIHYILITVCCNWMQSICIISIAFIHNYIAPCPLTCLLHLPSLPLYPLLLPRQSVLANVPNVQQVHQWMLNILMKMNTAELPWRLSVIDSSTHRRNPFSRALHHALHIHKWPRSGVIVMT